MSSRRTSSETLVQYLYSNVISTVNPSWAYRSNIYSYSECTQLWDQYSRLTFYFVHVQYLETTQLASLGCYKRFDVAIAIVWLVTHKIRRYRGTSRWNLPFKKCSHLPVTRPTGLPIPLWLPHTSLDIERLAWGMSMRHEALCDAIWPIKSPQFPLWRFYFRF